MTVSGNAVNPDRKVGYGWVVLLVTFLSGWTASSNMAKVTALAPVLMPYFGISTDALGLIIASFFILGFILAFPVAGMVGKLGIKVSMAIAVCCGIVGGIIGIFSANLPMFVVSRLVEGAGMGFVNVAGASALYPWFPREKRGLAMGCWGMWVASAMFICPALYSALVDNLGWSWTNVWIMMLIFDIVVLILFLILYREAPEGWNCEPIVEHDDSKGPKKGLFRSVFMIPAIWAVGLVFFFDEGAYMTISNFLSTYLTSDAVNATLTQSGAIISLGAVVGTILAPVAGKLSDVLHTRKWVLFIGLIAGIIYTALVFNLHSVTPYYGIAFIGGICGGFIPALIMTIAPEQVSDPAQVPVANAVVCFFQNLGICVGSLVLGGVITGLGWATASFAVLAPMYIIATLILLIGLRKVK